MDYSSHTFQSLSTGWGVSHYPEEAVGGSLGSQTALHTRRELVPPANSEVIIIVTCLLSEHENMNQVIQWIQGYTHMYCVKIKYKVHFCKFEFKCCKKNGANVSFQDVWNKQLILLFKDGDVTRVLHSVSTLAGLTTSEGGGVITPPCSMSLHWGSTATPWPPAAPVTIHYLCVYYTPNHIAGVNITEPA